MRTEKSDYLYLLFGIFCGFLLGSSVGQETGVWVRRFLSAGAVIFVALLWRWTESRAHTHHLEQWEELRIRGKWFFIISQYVLVRGIVLLVILAGPAAFELRFSNPIMVVAALSGALLVLMLMYLGHQEWNECEREFAIQSLRKAAEFIASKQN
jgi:hypothetical protein